MQVSFELIQDKRKRGILANAVVADVQAAHEAITDIVQVFKHPDYLLLENIYLLGVADGIRAERRRRKEKGLASDGNTHKVKAKTGFAIRF